MTKQHLLHIFVLTVSTFTLCGCTEMHWNFGGTKPTGMSFEPPPGPPEYQQGFRDGIESGYSGYANSFNKMFYTWKQDPVLAQNPVYYQIWKDAYAYGALWGMMADMHGWGNMR